VCFDYDVCVAWMGLDFKGPISSPELPHSKPLDAI
jgi:hypothetical protein